MNSDPNFQSSQSTHQVPTPPPPTPSPTASSRHTKQVIDRIEALVFAVLSLYCRLSLEECRKQEEQSRKEVGMKSDSVGDQEANFRQKLRASFVGVLDGIVRDYQRVMGKKDNCGEVIAFLTNSMTLPEKYVTRYSQTKYEQSCKKVFKAELSLIYPKIEQLVNWLLAYLSAKDPSTSISIPSLPLTDPQKQAQKQQLNNLTTIFTMFLSQKKKLDPSENEHNFYYIKILKCKGKLGLDEEFIRKWVGLKRDIAKERTGRAVQFVKIRVARLRALLGKLEKIREREQMEKGSIQVYPFESEKSKSETVSDKEKSKPQPESSQHTQLHQPPSSHQPPLHPQPSYPHPHPRAQKLLKLLLTVYKAPHILNQRSQIVRILHEAQTLLIKGFLRRVLSMAKLRNYRYSSALWGDQRRCFGEANQEAVGEIVVRRGKGFGLEDGDREGRKEMRFYQMRYPSRLEAYFQLRSNEQKHQQHLLQNYKATPLKIRLPTLKAYLFENEQTTKQPIEPVIEETPILSTRLKITVAMVKDALLDLYPHGEVFGAERALYRS